MFYVYILKSSKDNKCYIGSTRDLKNRLRLHQEGKIYSTKSRRPLVLVYYEAYRVEQDARLREKNLKNYGQGVTNLYKRLSKSLDMRKVQGE